MKNVAQTQTHHLLPIMLIAMLMCASVAVLTYGAHAGDGCAVPVPPGGCTTTRQSTVHLGFAVRGQYTIRAGSNAAQEQAISEANVTHHTASGSPQNFCTVTDSTGSSTSNTGTSCSHCSLVVSEFAASTRPPTSIMISCPGGPDPEDIIIGGGGGIIGEPLPGLCPSPVRTGWVETVGPYPGDDLHFVTVQAAECPCNPGPSTPLGCCDLCIPDYEQCQADGPPTNSYFDYEVTAGGTYNNSNASTATLRAEMSIFGELIDHIAVGEASMEPGAFWRLDYVVAYEVDNELQVDEYHVEIRYSGRDNLELDADGWEILDSNIVELFLKQGSDVQQTYQFEFGPFTLRRDVPLPAGSYRVSVTSSAGLLAEPTQGPTVGAADWNDLDRVLSMIGTLDRRADLNGDGVVDALDILQWIERYMKQFQVD